MKYARKTMINYKLEGKKMKMKEKENDRNESKR